MYFIGLSFAKIFPSLLKKVQVMLKQAPISEASLEWGLSILLKTFDLIKDFGCIQAGVPQKTGYP